MTVTITTAPQPSRRVPYDWSFEEPPIVRNDTHNEAEVSPIDGGFSVRYNTAGGGGVSSIKPRTDTADSPLNHITKTPSDSSTYERQADFRSLEGDPSRLLNSDQLTYTLSERSKAVNAFRASVPEIIADITKRARSIGVGDFTKSPNLAGPHSNFLEISRRYLQTDFRNVNTEEEIRNEYWEAREAVLVALDACSSLTGEEVAKDQS